MEEAIFNGLQIMFPNAKQLYCVRHLKQRDEIQIDKILPKSKCTERERMNAKKEILLDIYGQIKESLYEYGLAESSDENEFSCKLLSLQQKWESRCAGFYDWFCSNRKNKFITSVICSARNGTNVDGLFYQNDIESQHFVEKVHQNFEKKSVEDSITYFQRFIERQDDEEIRAVYGAGSYRFIFIDISY